MTKRELSRLYYLKKEIELQKRRIKELESAASSCGAPIRGLPSGSEVPDKVGSYAAQIADLKSSLERNYQRLVCELNILERYIQSVKDPLIRQIIHYRFAKGYSWTKIAWEVGGNNNSENLRKKIDRFLENN